MRLATNKSISESYKNPIIFYDAYLRIIFCNEIYSSKYAILGQILTCFQVQAIPYFLLVRSLN